jgi:hypothetical protein
MRTALTALTLLLATISLRAAAEDDRSKSAWKDLFDGKTLKDWKQSGYGGDETTVEDGKLVIPSAERLAGITYTGDAVPKINYEVELEARRVEGSDFFVGLTFPVNDSHASLILGGWGGSVCGISSLDDEDANDNATRKIQRFKKGQWYKVRLRVEPKRLQAWLDDQPLIDVDTTGKKVDIRPEIGASKPFGLASFATTAEIKSIRVRALDEAKKN